MPWSYYSAMRWLVVLLLHASRPTGRETGGLTNQE